MTEERANSTFYDADATSYDAERWESRGGEFTNRVQQAILGELTRGWSGRVLEVGPGTARFTIPLAKRGLRMTLLDISHEMLHVARGNLERASLVDRVEAFVEGSIYELPFDDGSFDHAISLNVFNHLERSGAALAELARVVRPGGSVLFNYANLRSWYWPAARRINARRTAVGQDVFSIWERPADMAAAIRAAGLRLERRLGNMHVPRAIERYRLLPLVIAGDAASRRGPLRGLAPVQFCLCAKDAAG